MPYIQKDFSTTQHIDHTQLLPCDHTDYKNETPEKDLLFFAFSVERNTNICDKWQNTHMHMHLYVYISIFISLFICIKMMFI